MPKLPNRGGPERHAKRSPRARPDRIIEKRARWEDYLDPEEDPGLIEDEEVMLLESDEMSEEEETEEDGTSEDGKSKG
jgi:hypothetical protein